jgi:hypothetical protein
MPSKPAAQTSDQDHRLAVPRQAWQMRGGDDQYSTPMYFNPKPVDVYGGGDKTSGYYSQEGRAAYSTPVYGGPSADSRSLSTERRVAASERVESMRVLDVENLHEKAISLVQLFEATLQCRRAQLDDEKEANSALRREKERLVEDNRVLRKENKSLRLENAELQRKKDYRADAKKALDALNEDLQKVKIENNLFRAAHQSLLKNISDEKKPEKKEAMAVWIKKFDFPEYTMTTEPADLNKGIFSDDEEEGEEQQG